MHTLIRILFVTVITWAITACDSDKTQQQAPKLPVNAMKIVNSSMPVVLNYIGITKSIANVGIRARVKGFLEKMNFTEGKFVERGSLMYVIDPRPYKAALDLAQANLDSSRANADYQKAELSRYADLVKKNFVSQEDYDDQKATYNEAVASVEVAEANVETAKIDLGYCYMYSPIDGIAGVRQYDVGNLVGTDGDTLLVSVVSLDPMFVYFSPSVQDFDMVMKYYKNMPFKVVATIPKFPDLKFEGQVDMINNEADQPTSTIQMRGLIKNPQKLLRPNIYVNVQLTLSPSQQVIKIPSSATYDMQGSTYVYVLDDKGNAQNREIQVAYSGSDYVVVQSGLKVGESLILNNIQKIHSNMPVKATYVKASV